MRIYKTITEHTHGRIADPSYSTGYKKRAGTERIPDPNGRRSKDTVRTLYEEAPAPQTWLYGEADPSSECGYRGTVRVVIEDVEPIDPFTAEEVEHVLHRLAHQYSTALFVLAGGSDQSYGKTPAEAFRDAAHAHKRFEALTGIDLDDTNVAFPLRLHKANWVSALPHEEVPQIPSVG